MEEKCLHIVPEPVEVRRMGDKTFRLWRGAVVGYSDRSVRFEAAYLADYALRYLGLPLSVKKLDTDDVATNVCAVRLVNAKNRRQSGGYRLTVDASGVVVQGNDAAGVFYGVQTLIQLLPTRAGIVPQLPMVEVTDYPRFAYRGMHLDVVRHYFPVAYIKQYIDRMALHKLNFFHWHLTDDQGWRLDLKCYPQLTQAGSMRAGEREGVYPGVYQEQPYGGYYTAEDVAEVVRYAQERHITVIPEVDIPGHCMAVLQAFPHFGTEPEAVKECAKTWHVFEKQNNVLAPTEEVFRFLTDVFNEVCDLFPGPYIHVGGDECAKCWWRQSPQAQHFMQTQGLKDEDALQSYFIHHVKAVLDQRGKTLVGWDEILDGGLSKDCIVMNWRRSSVGKRSAKAGYRTISTSIYRMYFNLKESASQREVGPDAIAIPVERVYEYAIVPEELSEQEAENIIGVQGCLWTEYTRSPWKVEFSAFPRMAALSENGWSLPERKGWSHFSDKLVTQLERYELWGIRYSPFFPRKKKVAWKR